MPLAVRAWSANQWIRGSASAYFLREVFSLSPPPLPSPYPVLNTAVMNSHVHNLGILVYLFLTEVELLSKDCMFLTAFNNKYCYLQKAYYHLHSHWQNTSACLPSISPSFFFFFLPALCDLQDISFQTGLNLEIESLNLTTRPPENELYNLKVVVVVVVLTSI